MNQSDLNSPSSKGQYLLQLFIKLLMIFHFDSFWVILGNFGSFCVILGHFGIFWVIWVHSESF